MPKCEIFVEIFDLLDFNNFYVMKCLYVGDLGAEIIFLLFYFWLVMYNFIFASECDCTVYEDNKKLF